MSRLICTSNDGRVYGDGERLIVDAPAMGGSLVLWHPFIQSFEIRTQPIELTCCNDDIRYFAPVYPEVHVSMIARQSEWHSQSYVPDLSSMAENLTISQLFAVIERKLNGREAKCSA